MMPVKLLLLVTGRGKSPGQAGSETTEDSRQDLNNGDKNGVTYTTAR